MPHDVAYDYTGVLITNETPAPGGHVMVVEPMLADDVGAADEGEPVTVVHVLPAAPVVPAVPATGGSETHTVRGFLVEAVVLSPSTPSMTWADLNVFVHGQLSG